MDNIQRLPATKSVLITLKEDLNTYNIGHDILEQKRELLLSDLLNYQYQYTEINRMMIDLFNLINEHLLNLLKIHYMKSENKNIMEIHVNRTKLHGTVKFEIELLRSELINFFDSFEGYGPVFDSIINKFKELVSHIKDWLELYSTMYNILREVEKTSKRVRALENIFIPQYKRKIKEINDALEEKEREDFVRRKKIKELKR
ncbi:V-type ATP synthase subunit D [bacterium]|nr:V-type ATP synthase subunit D [bacterium]